MTNKEKKTTFIQFILLMLAFLFCFFSMGNAYAATSINSAVYIQQAGSLTCTLASATMVMRARAQLSGYNSYTSITENAVSNTAWSDSGLLASFTYSFDGNSISMKRANTGGSMPLSSLKTVLDDHPEGIVLYCVGGGAETGWSDAHAVFVTDCEGDTVYCKDPAYHSGRIMLADSRLGALYGSQSNILNNTTNYWYVSSYSITPSNPRKNILSGVYVIHSAWDDDFVLDIQGNSRDNNANIQLYRKENSSVQKFRVIRWNEDYYCIQSIYSGKWLDVALPIENKANVKLFNTNEAPEDHWYFEDAEGGYVYIKNMTGLYLDLENNTAENHSNISLYEFTGKDNKSQKWRLEDVTAYYSLEDGIYSVHSAINHGYALDIQGNSKELRANIQLYEKINTSVQLFRFSRADRGYTIQSVYSNMWLDIKTPIGNHSNVQLWQSHDADEENWILEDAGNGYVFIRSNADYYLDVQGDSAKNNANIQVYHFMGNNSQKWYLKNVTENAMVLPQVLTGIESEAFIGVNAEIFVLPDTVSSIGANAFDANVMILGSPGSAAEDYAKENNLEFISFAPSAWITGF